MLLTGSAQVSAHSLRPRWGQGARSLNLCNRFQTGPDRPDPADRSFCDSFWEKLNRGRVFSSGWRRLGAEGHLFVASHSLCLAAAESENEAKRFTFPLLCFNSKWRQRVGLLGPSQLFKGAHPFTPSPTIPIFVGNPSWWKVFLSGNHTRIGLIPRGLSVRDHDRSWTHPKSIDFHEVQFRTVDLPAWLGPATSINSVSWQWIKWQGYALEVNDNTTFWLHSQQHSRLFSSERFTMLS